MPSALFANQREANLASMRALVEQALAELGHPAPSCRASDPAALASWQVPLGSTGTRVTLIHRADFTHLRVCATLLQLDASVDRAGLFAHLLELNASLCGAAFATTGDRVQLVAERSTLDLDRSEVLELIRRVTTYADEHGDVLRARFGGRRGA